MSESRSTYTQRNRDAGDILPLGRSPKALAQIQADAAELDAINKAARERFNLPPVVRVPAVVVDAIDEAQAEAARGTVERVKRGRYARPVMPSRQYEALRQRALAMAAERPLLWQRLVVKGRISWEAMVAFRDGTRVLALYTTLKLQGVLARCYDLAIKQPRRKPVTQAKAKGKGKGLRS